MTSHPTPSSIVTQSPVTLVRFSIFYPCNIIFVAAHWCLTIWIVDTSICMAVTSLWKRTYFVWHLQVQLLVMKHCCNLLVLIHGEIAGGSTEVFGAFTAKGEWQGDSRYRGFRRAQEVRARAEQVDGEILVLSGWISDGWYLVLGWRVVWSSVMLRNG